MMMYAIPRVDGGVAIMQVIEGADPAKEIARWHKDEQARVDVSGIRPVDPQDIPTDRTFRNAWRPDLTCDLEKAREIWKQRMRHARIAKLAALDLEMSRAFKDLARQEQVEAKRQELRDVTAHPDIAAAKTPEALKAVWPECLK